MLIPKNQLCRLRLAGVGNDYDALIQIRDLYDWEYQEYIALSTEPADVYKSRLHNPTSLDSKNVFIDKKCTISTVFLQNNGITRKRSLSNADIHIVPDLNFVECENYNILYDEESNRFILCSLGDFSYRRPEGCTSDEYFSYVMSQTRFCNCPVIHKGPLYLVNPHDYDFCMNIESYKNTVFERDYLLYLNSLKPVITSDVFETLKSITKSRQVDDYNMAIQLLYQYNVLPHSYSFYKFWSCLSRDTIKQTDTFNSVSYRTFFKTIGLSDAKFHSNYIDVENAIFNQCCEEEKDKILKTVLSCIRWKVSETNNYMKRYRFLNVIVEPMKVIYNGKDYLDPRSKG